MTTERPMNAAPGSACPVRTDHPMTQLAFDFLEPCPATLRPEAPDTPHDSAPPSGRMVGFDRGMP